MKHIKHPQLMRLASYFSVVVAIMIALSKIYGFHKTSSTSILASLIDSLLDLTASIVNVVAIRYALMPPDDEHRFGHDKIQDLAVFGQSIFFGLSALVITFAAIQKFIAPTSIVGTEIGINVMVAAIILTLVLVIFQSYVIYKTNTKVIEADRLHYLSDLLTNIAVIISVYLSGYYGYQYADPAFAILIALYIFYGSWKLFKGALANLIDQEFSDEEKDIIIDIISKSKQVQNFHDLKTRYAGNKAFIQFHIELDGSTTVNKAFTITENLEHAMKEAFPGSEVMIRQDPKGKTHRISYRD